MGATKGCAGDTVRFPYMAAKKKKKSYTKKQPQDFMVRQKTKGYGELQVMHVASLLMRRMDLFTASEDVK